MSSPDATLPSPRSSASRVTRSQRILVSAQLLRVVLFVSVTLLLGRWLTPAEFGFVALVSSLFLATQELLDMGTTAVTTRQVAQGDAGTERRTLEALLAWRRLLSLGLAAAVLVLALWGPVTQLEQRTVLVAASAALLLMSLSTYHVVFQTRQAFGRASLLALGTQGSFLLAGAALLKAHAAGALVSLSAGAAMGLLVVAREVVQVLGSRWLAVKMLGYRLRAAWLHPGLRPLLGSAWVFGLAGVSYKLSALMGGFFLWALQPAQALGTFSAAQRLFGPLIDTAWMFATPLIAALAITARRQPAVLQLQLSALTTWLLALSCSVAVGGQFVGPWVLQLLYGSQYAQGDASAVAVFEGLSLGLMFALVTPVLAVACLAQGHDKLLMRVSVAGLLLNITSNALLVPRWGAPGAAVAWCLSEAGVALFLLFFAFRRGEIVLTWNAWLYLLPAGLLAALLPALHAWPTWQFVVGAVVLMLGLLLLRALPSQQAARSAVARMDPETEVNATANATATASASASASASAPGFHP